MVILASVFAVLAALLHVLFFAYESLLFERPDVHARFQTRTQDVPAVKPWAYNQGFYNLFLAIGALVGAGLALAGQETVGLALILLACGSMLAAALVLVATNRSMARAAATQGTFPLLAVVFAVLALVSG